jgi:hypothetical protein
MLRQIAALLVAGWIEDCWVADKMAPGATWQGAVCEESVPKSSGVGLRIVRGARTRLTWHAGAGRDRQPGRDLTLSSVKGYDSGNFESQKRNSSQHLLSGGAVLA